MHHVTPDMTPDADLSGRDGRTSVVAFAAAVLSLVAVFAAVGTTIPMFNLYRAEDGFTDAGITLAVVVYSAVTLGTLLVLGRLSTHVGRRPTAIASLGLAVLGCVLLLNVHHVGILIAGRLLMGLSAGLASTSVTAYVVDVAPTRPAWLASVASSQTVMLGLALGAVGAGALIEFAPWPRDLAYVAVIGVLTVSVGLIAISPETVTRSPGIWRSLHPTVRVPGRIQYLVPVAAAVLLATWATGAFYQAFVPPLLEDELRTDSKLVVGLVFAAYMGASAAGAPLNGRLSPAAAQRTGMVAFLAGWIGLVAAIFTGGLPLFVAATVVAGAAQGIVISAVTRGLLYGSTPVDRAPIFSAIYLLSYSGATVPSLIAAQLSKIMPLSHLAVGYGALVVVCTVFTVGAARNPYEAPAADPNDTNSLSSGPPVAQPRDKAAPPAGNVE